MRSYYFFLILSVGIALFLTSCNLQMSKPGEAKSSRIPDSSSSSNSYDSELPPGVKFFNPAEDIPEFDQAGCTKKFGICPSTDE